MSNPTRESFRQFNKLDPQARLEEFQKRFDRLKSEFQNPQRPMFESENRQFFPNQPSWTGPSDNMHSTNGHVHTEKTIPIHVQHERSRSEPMDNSSNTNQAGSSPNMNDRMHFIPENSFFQHKFPHHFANNEAAAEPSGESRVHHIPIQVESRNSTAAPMTKPAPPNQQHNSGPVSSQNVAPQANHPIQTAQTTSSFNDATKPTRVIDVPIQITKSSSTPETSKKCENVLQQSASPNVVNPSASPATSDPAIADPNKVYAMGYEPIQSNNQPSKANSGEAKKETPFDFVREILDDLKNYESQVHEFNGTNPADKGYRFLDEMLTLCILRLDCINIDGDDELRKYRKSAINEVNRVVAILEAKVSKAPQKEAQNESQNCENDTSTVQINVEATETGGPSGSDEPKDKKEAKKLEKAKAKKEKEKAKKEPSEKKEGRKIILFRGKNKNKTNATESNDPASMDVDPNNNDLKEDSNQSTSSDQNPEVASTSSGSTLQGKETAV